MTGEGEDVDEVPLFGSRLWQPDVEEEAVVRSVLNACPREGGGGVKTVFVLC